MQDRLHAVIEILSDQRERKPPDEAVLALLEDTLAHLIDDLSELLPGPEKAQHNAQPAKRMPSAILTELVEALAPGAG